MERVTAWEMGSKRERERGPFLYYPREIIAIKATMRYYAKGRTNRGSSPSSCITTNESEGEEERKNRKEIMYPTIKRKEPSSSYINIKRRPKTSKSKRERPDEQWSCCSQKVLQGGPCSWRHVPALSLSLSLS